MEIELSFAAFINKRYLDDLHEILFFNPYQKNYRNKIILAIEECGKPEIIEENDLITVRLNKDHFQQTLFVVEKSEEKKLLALIVYKKENEVIEIIQLAFSPFCKELFLHKNISVFEATIFQFATMISSIKDVKFIKFYYKSMVLSIDKIKKMAALKSSNI